MLRIALWLVLSLHGAAAFAQPADLALLGRAETLVRSGKPDEAWRLLAPLERRHAGEPEFDYLLAVAALESGRPDRATFVLERVLAAQPGHLAARLEMARAYFELRDFERAEREFGFLLRGAPAPEVRRLSESYLAAMRGSAARPQRSGVTGYAELTAGHDSNVSAASADNSVFVPGLGAQFVPDARFQRRADEFLGLGAGLEYARPLGGGASLAGSVDLRQRWHSHADAFDARAADLELALIRPLGERSQLQLSGHYGDYRLDNAPYRESYSLAAQWSRNLGPRWRIAVSGQGYRIRYRSTDTAENSSDLVAAGLSALHVLDPSTLTTVSGALYVGHDNAVAGRPDGDRRLVGASLGLQRRLTPALEAYLRFSLLESRYGMENADFGVLRRDHQHDAALGMAWAFAPGWQLRPQVSRTVNRSNLPLSEYRRTETSLTLRRVWD